MTPPKPSTNLSSKSVFTGQNNTYVYLSQNEASNRILYILKGIYGYHETGIQSSSRKLDKSLITHLQQSTNIVICNTGRKATDDPASREAFEGKTFKMEILDTLSSFAGALSWVQKHRTVEYEHLFGHSFGGTIAINLNELTHRCCSVTIFGSGCGGGSEKPLRPATSQMFETDILRNIRPYRGLFTLIQGTEDTKVPLDSGKKIFDSAESAQVKQHIMLRGVDHTGKLQFGKESPIPHEMIQAIKLSNMQLSEALWKNDTN